MASYVRSKAYGDQTFAVDVEKVAVNISNPAINASVTSRVNIVANGSSAKDITGWQIYVDGISSFNKTMRIRSMQS